MSSDFLSTNASEWNDLTGNFEIVKWLQGRFYHSSNKRNRILYTKRFCLKQCLIEHYPMLALVTCHSRGIIC